MKITVNTAHLEAHYYNPLNICSVGVNISADHCIKGFCLLHYLALQYNNLDLKYKI